jgi:plasmid stabilization system protein ParE
MAAVRYTARALDHLERLTEFLAETVPDAAADTAKIVVEAIDILHRHPEIGRPGEDDYRELIISRGRTGYIALYVYDEHDDMVVVHAIGHQREAGYV